MTTYPQPDTFPSGASLQEGVWVQTLIAKDASDGRAALFLDRDGVVCEEVNYLHKAEDVALSTGAIEVIKAANANGVMVVIITNQAGIGYGKYGWNEFIAVQDRLLHDIEVGGGRIDGVFACPFHEIGQPPYNHPDHPARKPNPAMLHMAHDLMGIDLAKSWIVGDRASDLEAGKNASIAGGVHVLSGHGSREGERDQALALNDQDYEVKTANGIGDTIHIIGLLSNA